MGYERFQNLPIGFEFPFSFNGSQYTARVLHKGNPDKTVYGAEFDNCAIIGLKECEGTNLITWHSIDSQNFETSTIKSTLEKFNNFDTDKIPMKEALVQVKWPYRNGEEYKILENGWQSYFCIESGTNLGGPTEDPPYDKDLIPLGAKFDFYDWVNYNYADPKREKLAKPTATSNANYWILTPFCRKVGTGYSAWYVQNNGALTTSGVKVAHSISPIFAIHLSAWIDESGDIVVNFPPEGSFSSASYGTVASFPNVQYTVTDFDDESVTVTEKLDGIVYGTKTLTSGATENFNVPTPQQWLRLEYGQHTLTIEYSDGYTSKTATSTFSKKLIPATVSHKTGFATQELAAVAVMRLIGNIPEDAEVKIELTNNFSDSAPVWEDATAELLAGRNYALKNKTAVNGPVYNFRITLSRGPSGTGGYLSGIAGTFQGADE